MTREQLLQELKRFDGEDVADALHHSLLEAIYAWNLDIFTDAALRIVLDELKTRQTIPVAS